MIEDKKTNNGIENSEIPEDSIMCIKKIPDFISVNKHVLVYENVLSEYTVKECIDFANKCIENDIYCTTNHESWRDFLVGDSEIIKVINLFNKNKILAKKICNELSNKYNMITEGLKLNIHIMQEGCYINNHTDNHVKYAFTIYLNDNWEDNDGGIFQYEVEDEVYSIVPKYNKMVIIKDNVHRVTKITKNIKRITIQGFYNHSYYFKNTPIDVILNNKFENNNNIYF
jgi:hypothetical protein